MEACKPRYWNKILNALGFECQWRSIVIALSFRYHSSPNLTLGEKHLQYPGSVVTTLSSSVLPSSASGLYNLLRSALNLSHCLSSLEVSDFCAQLSLSLASQHFFVLFASTVYTPGHPWKLLRHLLNAEWIEFLQTLDFFLWSPGFRNSCLVTLSLLWLSACS